MADNVDEEIIKRYIGGQYERDRIEGDSGKRQRAAFERSPAEPVVRDLSYRVYA